MMDVQGGKERDVAWEPLPAATVGTVSAGMEGWRDAQPEVKGPVAAIVSATGSGSAWCGRIDLSRADRDAEAGAGDQILLWSVSKAILAAATFRLIENDHLRLGMPIASLLPEAPVHPEATLQHLLSHTAGVPDYGGWPDYHEAVRRHPGQPWPLDRYLERARAIGPVARPGELWVYSNIGYLLVRRVIERVTGQSLGEALDRLLFRPAELTGIGLSRKPGDRGDLAFGTEGRLARMTAANTYHPGWVAHGVVSATVKATALFFDQLFDGHVLSPESLREMTTLVIDVAPATPYGRLGWAPGVLVGTGSPIGSVVGHTGGGPGSTTAALRVTDSAGRWVTVVAAVSDEREQGAGEIAMRVAGSLFGIDASAGRAGRVQSDVRDGESLLR